MSRRNLVELDVWDMKTDMVTEHYSLVPTVHFCNYPPHSQFWCFMWQMQDVKLGTLAKSSKMSLLLHHSDIEW
jgi:hypothetical protein